MGFWDREVRDTFDSLFDLNRDGMLDPAEQAFQLDFLTRKMKDETCEEHGGDLELDDLEFMDEDERREALEDAGYDPDDFDDDFDDDFFEDEEPEEKKTEKAE